MSLSEICTAAAAVPVPVMNRHTEIEAWLESGKLALLDASRRSISADEYRRLPAESRERALQEFRRVISPNAKAAVLFLR